MAFIRHRKSGQYSGLILVAGWLGRSWERLPAVKTEDLHLCCRHPEAGAHTASLAGNSDPELQSGQSDLSQVGV